VGMLKGSEGWCTFVCKDRDGAFSRKLLIS
jgi:hypothetical protein